MQVSVSVNLRAAVEYVLSKRGSDGGYLFYQYLDMFESSAEDTYFALATLKALGVDPPDREKTVRFLRSRQLEDGSYRSVEVAYYAVKALSLLGETPTDPEGAASFLRRSLAQLLARPDLEPTIINEEEQEGDGPLKSKDATALLTPADMPSAADEIAMSVVALKALGYDLAGLEEPVASFLLALRKSDGGFGARDVSVESTYRVLEALHALNRLPQDLEPTLGYLRRSENPEGGFSASPYTKSNFIEHLYFGLTSLRILGAKPNHRAAHIDYVAKCQSEKGGFKRTPLLGIPTIEYTYYAVASLKELGAI
ncbi:prenyltransferase/squalene oxidase repeat-containing protein [Infirmifilum sp. NZ]|uniref:prenyltransferase/squalene oxidase repeat-containing protein n=1 Tax=Infirmifilum sp. NZ TaxID=2926850 RepID=UPI00279B20B5|nr:prenyltransferase/squalene oxidase repeat-containing protein [Infirmifilum sp. NZ]UNQ73792.1 hypothetical protein MOV14_01965 [Infirmifilum sp. NZ]